MSASPQPLSPLPSERTSDRHLRRWRELVLHKWRDRYFDYIHLKRVVQLATARLREVQALARGDSVPLSSSTSPFPSPRHRRGSFGKDAGSGGSTPRRVSSGASASSASASSPAPGLSELSPSECAARGAAAIVDRLDLERAKVNEFYLRKFRYLQHRNRLLKVQIAEVTILPERLAKVNSSLVIHAALISVLQALRLFRREITELQRFCRANVEGMLATVVKVKQMISAPDVSELALATLPLLQTWKENMMSMSFFFAATDDGPLERMVHRMRQHTKAIRSLMPREEGAIRSLIRSLGVTEPMSSTELRSNAMQPERLLHFAVRRQNLRAIRALLDRVENIDAPDEHEVTPLSVACRNGFLKIATELLARGANVSSFSVTMRTPLHWAAMTGHIDIVNILFAHGAEAEPLDQDLRCPLHMAAMRDHEGCVKILIRNGASINCQDASGQTPLAIACAEGSLTTAKALLGLGADPGIPDWRASHAIHLAAAGGHTSCVTALLQFGVSVAVFDSNGASPLQLAAAHGHTETLEVLLQHTIEHTRKVVASGVTHYELRRNPAAHVPSMLAVSDESDVHWTSTVRLIDHVNADGWTALHGACAGGHTECVKALMRAGVYPIGKDRRGWSPRVHALYHGHLELAQLLPPRSVSELMSLALPVASDAFETQSPGLPPREPSASPPGLALQPSSRTPLSVNTAMSPEQPDKLVLEASPPSPVLVPQMYRVDTSYHERSASPSDGSTASPVPDSASESGTAAWVPVSTESDTSLLPMRRASTEPPHQTRAHESPSTESPASQSPPRSAGRRRNIFLTPHGSTSISGSEPEVSALALPQPAAEAQAHPRSIGSLTSAAASAVSPSLQRRHSFTSLREAPAPTQKSDKPDAPVAYCQVTFRVQATTRSDQYLCIVGDCEELGQWNPLGAFTMTRADEDHDESNLPTRIVDRKRSTRVKQPTLQTKRKKNLKKEKHSKRKPRIGSRPHAGSLGAVSASSDSEDVTSECSDDSALSELSSSSSSDSDSSSSSLSDSSEYSESDSESSLRHRKKRQARKRKLKKRLKAEMKRKLKRKLQKKKKKKRKRSAKKKKKKQKKKKTSRRSSRGSSSQLLEPDDGGFDSSDDDIFSLGLAKSRRRRGDSEPTDKLVSWTATVKLPLLRSRVVLQKPPTKPSLGANELGKWSELRKKSARYLPPDGNDGSSPPPRGGRNDSPPPGTPQKVTASIAYKYIVRSKKQSQRRPGSLESWEVLPSNRKVMLAAESEVLVDDGVFGTRPGGPKDSEGAETWVEQGWLVNETQVQIMLGHVTVKHKRPLIHWFDSGGLEPVVDHVVIRCGPQQLLPSDKWVESQTHRIQLPVQEPLEPFLFHVPCDDPAAHLHLQFEVYGITGPCIARSHVLPGVMLDKLEGKHTCPLVGRKSHLVLGELSFEFLLIRPFEHPLMNRALGRTFSKSTRVIGHRGTGANKYAMSGQYHRSHIKENTILSFVTAGSMGAQYVEFDVQLTRDLVPVVYHDFLFQSEAQHFTTPISNVTLDEFVKSGLRRARRRSISSLRELKLGLAGGEGLDVELGADISRVDRGGRFVRRSESGPSMISDSITTLAETLVLLPESLGFNLEIKIPNENERESLHLHPVDRNTYVERILETVFEYAGNRPILFSSFDPDICTITSLKQPTYPVFLITEGGLEKCYDPRLNSIHGAVRFARSAGLLGIVSYCVPLVEGPEIIEFIRSAGLLLCTWGNANNDTDAVKIQKRYGVDSVIVDHVAHIAGFLQQQEESLRGAAAVPGKQGVVSFDSG